MLAAAALLLAIPTARADFAVNVVAGGNTFTVVDNSADDDNPTTGQIGLTNSGAGLGSLNAFLTNFAPTLNFANLGAQSNRTTGSGGIANVTVNGQVNGTGSLEVVVTDTDFSFPVTGPGDSASLSSSGSQTYTNAADGSNGSFQSFFNQNNSQFGRVTPTGILSFTPNPGENPSSPTGVLGGGSNPVVLGVISTPFSLTNSTVLNLVGTANTNVGFTGSTAVGAVAVPEPGSVALLLLGGSALALRARRRRNA